MTSLEAFRKQFQDLTSQSIESQLEFFLKRYIFTLGADWKQCADLATKFASYTDARNGVDLNHTEASDFLQKNGKTRTAKERSEELKDIDLDNNGRICFIEYLLLHYKVMVIKDFFEKKQKPIPQDIDLTKDGIGVNGVGNIILEALFTFGNDIDPKIEKAIEEVMQARKERDDRMDGLKKTVADVSKTQVQRMKAQHELLRLENEDTTGADVALITLMASKRKVQRNARNAKEENEKALNEEKKQKEAENNQKKMASKNNLFQMRNRFQSNAKTDPKKYQNKAQDRASIKAIMAKGSHLYTASARKEA